MKKNNYSDRKKSNDYIIYCDICGQPCWHSQSTKLEKETGKGGLIVCPTDRDSIDYGLIPFKILPEINIPIARINMQDTTTLYDGFDFTLNDPMGVSPGHAASRDKTWDQLEFLTWNQWDIPWGES